MIEKYKTLLSSHKTPVATAETSERYEKIISEIDSSIESSNTYLRNKVFKTRKGSQWFCKSWLFLLTHMSRSSEKTNKRGPRMWVPRDKVILPCRYSYQVQQDTSNDIW